MSANAEVIHVGYGNGSCDSGGNIYPFTNVKEFLHHPELKHPNSTPIALEKACPGQYLKGQMIHLHEIQRLVISHVFDNGYRILNESQQRYPSRNDYNQRYSTQTNKQHGAQSKEHTLEGQTQPNGMPAAETALSMKRLTVHTYKLI